MSSADTARPAMPDAVVRIAAFATALGLTVDHLASLLESYDLCLLDGKAPVPDSDPPPVPLVADPKLVTHMIGSGTPVPPPYDEPLNFGGGIESVQQIDGPGAGGSMES